MHEPWLESGIVAIDVSRMNSNPFKRGVYLAASLDG